VEAEGIGFARSCLELVVEREPMEKRRNEWKNCPVERVADGRSNARVLSRSEFSAFHADGCDET
jgi:hypothetical protein